MTEQDSNYVDLCSVIGHFFINFARMESAFNAKLRLIVAEKMADGANKSNIAIAASLFGGLRYKSAKEHILRIAAIEGVSESTIIKAKDVFSRISAIEDFRNKIAHNSVSPSFPESRKDWQITTATNTNDIFKFLVVAFNSDDVMNAATDLLLATEIICGEYSEGHILKGFESRKTVLDWNFKSSDLKVFDVDKLKSIS